MFLIYFYTRGILFFFFLSPYGRPCEKEKQEIARGARRGGPRRFPPLRVLPPPPVESSDAGRLGR